MPKIVSIHSFRGGTGKSNVTANLATIVAGWGNRVGIIDTDIQSPGIHVLFGLDEKTMDKSLNDYLWGECAIEETAYDVSSVLAPVKGESGVAGGAVYLVPSSIKAGEIVRILRDGYDVSLLNDGFSDLISRLRLDYLLIDTHPGLNEETLLSVAVSDILIIILRPDQQDYQGTAVTVDVAQKLDVPQTMLLINKAIPAFDFEALRKEVESSYGLPVTAVLPLSEEMIGLGSGGIFCNYFPNHPLSQCFRQIAGQIMGYKE